MKFIIVDNNSGKARSFTANGFLLGLTFLSLIGFPTAAGYLSYRHGMGEAALTNEMVGKWRLVLKDQEQQIEDAKRDAEDNLEASALRLAQLQARIVRLDALGERLTDVAGIEEGEFDFSSPPPMGGPEVKDNSSARGAPSYLRELSRLADDIDSREQQLSVLETLFVNRNIQNEVFIAGRPVKKGWMSSRFGMRVDPITGKRAFHNGVDFAGKLGADVVAVAAGVVVYADARSGRSTGPHVHYEVYKNGRVVDPSSYVQRASR